MEKLRSEIEMSCLRYAVGVNYKTASADSGGYERTCPMWNPHCQTRENAGPLEELVESYELIVNIDRDYAARPASQGRISNIDLVLSSRTPESGPLFLWEILEEYPSLSDHELIFWDVMIWSNKISPAYPKEPQWDGVFKGF